MRYANDPATFAEVSALSAALDKLADRVAAMEKREPATTTAEVECERCGGTGKATNKSACPGRISEIDCPDCTPQPDATPANGGPFPSHTLTSQHGTTWGRIANDVAARP